MAPGDDVGGLVAAIRTALAALVCRRWTDELVRDFTRRG